MSYGDAHRFLLRTVLSEGVIGYSDAQGILVVNFPETQESSIENLVEAINDKIRCFQQEIKIVNDEVTLEKCIVFLNTGVDAATMSQNMFSAEEIKFFRSLLEEIMTTESRQISSIYALNLVNELNVSKTKAEKLLNTWCRMYYLVEINGNYALGLRAIHEFQHYIQENMPDTIHKCCLCKDIVFRGYNCPHCGDAVHTRCLNMHVEADQKWPCCEANFNMAQLETLNDESFSQNQQSTQPTNETRNSSSEESNVSDEESEETPGSPIPGGSQNHKLF